MKRVAGRRIPAILQTPQVAPRDSAHREARESTEVQCHRRRSGSSSSPLLVLREKTVNCQFVPSVESAELTVNCRLHCCGEGGGGGRVGGGRRARRRSD